MRVLLIGDIYGQTGRKMIAHRIPLLKKKLQADWIIANAENATGGTGVSPKHRNSILASGIDMLTGGNHIFARPDWRETLTTSPALLRPHNLGGDNLPGKGWAILNGKNGPALAVICLAGRIFMEPADCPFQWADKLLARLPRGIPVFVDFHAEATSEKIAMAWYLDGRVTFVAGTHTHVQTSDERILPQGTGTITDLGMTGPRDGVLGVERETVISRFTKGYSEKFLAESGPGVLEGVAVDVSSENLTQSVTRIRVNENES